MSARADAARVGASGNGDKSLLFPANYTNPVTVGVWRQQVRGSVSPEAAASVPGRSGHNTSNITSPDLGDVNWFRLEACAHFGGGGVVRSIRS